MRKARGASWVVLAGGTGLVIASSLPYLLPGLRHPFLIERLPLSFDSLWLWSLKLHVAGGLFCLPAGLALVTGPVRRRWPALHRRLGRAYAAVVMCVIVPSGVHLAPHSKYGWASGSGFVTSAVVAAAATAWAIAAAKHGSDGAHRTAALHAYAQVASAISFRVYHLALQAVELGDETTYVASVWLSVVGNAAAVELILRFGHERSHHEISRPPERSVRAALVEP